MRTIVVGVDGSATSNMALRWALQEARQHGATVCAVHGWSLPYHQGAIGHLAGETMHEPLERAAAQTLDEAVGEVLEAVASGGDVPRVERHLVQAPAARALIDAAADADLLVVGSRGRGGFAGLLLGSVSQCAQHAACPVVIVRGVPDQDPPQP